MEDVTSDEKSAPEMEYFLAPREEEERKTDESAWQQLRKDFSGFYSRSMTSRQGQVRFVALAVLLLLLLAAVVLLLAYFGSMMSGTLAVKSEPAKMSSFPPRPRITTDSPTTQIEDDVQQVQVSTQDDLLTTTIEFTTTTLLSSTTTTPATTSRFIGILPSDLQEDTSYNDEKEDSPEKDDKRFDLLPTLLARSRAILEKPIDIDCIGYYAKGGSSGVYEIRKGQRKFEAFCDMDTADNTWTVVQRRVSEEEPFYNRTWQEYVEGFGSLEGSHWLGLKHLSDLAPLSGSYQVLRIELRGDSCLDPPTGKHLCSGNHHGYWFGEWDFRVGDETTDFILDILPMSAGNLTLVGSQHDPLYEINNQQRFATFDHYHDPSLNCAQFRNFGGWWHNNCTEIALNGMYGDKRPVVRYMVYQHSERSPFGMLKKTYPIHPRETVMLVRPKY